MDEQTLATLNEALAEVMNRFRNFFIGPGVNMREENVPFRHRDDFHAPLVTVMGHTYGVRLITESDVEGKKKKKKSKKEKIGVEVSVNVYSNEFQIERFKKRLKDEYNPQKIEKTIVNFMSPRDEIYAKDKGPLFFSEFFTYDLDNDLIIFQKKKKTASKITGMLIDTILAMRYWIRPEHLDTLTQDPKLFSSAVYLYCLRIFTIAYRKSLTLQERRLIMQRSSR